MANNIITLPGKIDISQIEGLTDYSRQYLTFEALEDGTFQFTKAINYSIDNGTTWVALAANTNTPTITTGNKIMWKAELTPDSSSGIGTFNSTGNFNIEGNAMSLLYGDNFVGQTDLTGKNYVFYNLFNACTKLINVKNLSLPATTLSSYCYQYMFNNCTNLITTPIILSATTLTNYCYRYMFNNCTSLTTAPELPATTLASSCYYSMFSGCTSLTTAPKLPATTLASSCYASIFGHCTSLTTAPNLPATTLAAYCYQQMFYGCTSLTTAPELPATTLASSCYYSMFSGCTSLTTAPKLPAVTLKIYCYFGMFINCTSLTIAPELHATTLISSCYQSMFKGCTNLITAPELPATTLATYCYSSMFEDCTSLTAAPNLPATILVSDCYNAMFSGCTSLNYIKAMFITTPSGTYTANWVSNVAATGIFVKNSRATWTTTGSNGVPSIGWLTCNDLQYGNNFGISTTSARTSTKTVIIPTIKELHIGQTIIVKPTTTATSFTAIKLNNFTAYTAVVYSRETITVGEKWTADVSRIWVFDGTNWIS